MAAIERTTITRKVASTGVMVIDFHVIRTLDDD